LASVLLHRDSEPGPETGNCAIVVLYEDNSSRDAAIRLCNSLEKIFHSEIDFEITWCRFKYFNDPAVAREAAEIAAGADLLIVAIQRPEELPLEVQVWFERWLQHRKSSEGALVLLQTSESTIPAISQNPYLYLLAQRANFDFISLSNTNSFSTERIPEYLKSTRPPDSTRNSEHYSRFGINE